MTKEKIKLNLTKNKYANVNQSVSNVGFKEYCVNETCKTLAKKQRDNFNKRFNQCQKKLV